MEKEGEATTRRKIDRSEAASRVASAARARLSSLSPRREREAGKKTDATVERERKRESERVSRGEGSAFGWRVHLRKMAAVARFARPVCAGVFDRRILRQLVHGESRNDANSASVFPILLARRNFRRSSADSAEGLRGRARRRRRKREGVNRAIKAVANADGGKREGKMRETKRIDGKTARCNASQIKRSR